MAYAKLQCLNGEDCYLTTLPFIIGSDPYNDLYIPCPQLKPQHCIIDFSGTFRIQALGPTLLVKSGLISEEDPPVELRDLSCISLKCSLHPAHVYYFITASYAVPQSELPKRVAIPHLADAYLDSFPSRQADSSTLKKWGINERENLKKWLLTYGYKRWKKIQEAMSEGGAFSCKQVQEIRSFSTALVRTISENLPFEKQELKKNLQGMAEEAENDFYVPPRIKDWGMMVRQRAVPWGKRLYMLFKIKELIKRFKLHFKEEGVKWGALLNFIPSSAFYGQRPSAWWTKRHDVDLVRGTYKHGYANYTQMKGDSALSFSLVDTDSTFKQFPSADTITRRLKKIMMFVEKTEEFDFDQEQELFEATEWRDNEKSALVQILTDEGISLNAEGKNDWAALKEKFDLRVTSDKPASSFEKMVQHLRMLAQLIIHPEEAKEQVSDADGFSMDKADAESLQDNFNKIQFIRKHIIKGNMLDNELASLEKATDRLRSENPDAAPWLSPAWKCSVHDKGLLCAVADTGMRALLALADNPLYSFQGVSISPDEARSRADYLCEFFKAISNIQKCSKKKRPTEDLTFDERGQIKLVLTLKKPKFTKFVVPRDEHGDAIYPLVINNSLSILNLGVVETQRPLYHSGRNIFPVGYKSIREHSSMFKPKDRMQYLCEILDGGQKPLFKVTPMAEGEVMEDYTIIKESCTGCWIVICNKVNEIQKSRRSKVTVSGTDRFGLWDPNVVKLIHSLPGADLLIPSQS